MQTVLKRALEIVEFYSRNSKQDDFQLPGSPANLAGFIPRLPGTINYLFNTYMKPLVVQWAYWTKRTGECNGPVHAALVFES